MADQMAPKRLNVGNIRQLSEQVINRPVRSATIDAQIRALVDATVEEALHAQAQALRDLVAEAGQRWPERMPPRIAAEYLGYAGPDSMADGWKGLKHLDPFTNGSYYLKSEIDAALRSH